MSEHINIGPELEAYEAEGAEINRDDVALAQRKLAHAKRKDVIVRSIQASRVKLIIHNSRVFRVENGMLIVEESLPSEAVPIAIDRPKK